MEHEDVELGATILSENSIKLPNGEILFYGIVNSYQIYVIREKLIIDLLYINDYLSNLSHCLRLQSEFL